MSYDLKLDRKLMKNEWAGPDQVVPKIVKTSSKINLNKYIYFFITERRYFDEEQQWC